MIQRCPFATWEPWRPVDAVGRHTYYRDANKPVAVVLHVMEGWMSTVLMWARTGFYPKSWHYSIGRDGTIYQHLEHRHGGYHAGITAEKARNSPPDWALWQGPNVNVNNYVIGIEHEGFAGQPFTQAQAEASRRLCRWLAGVLDIPMDTDHFPHHGAIDVRDRVNCFNTAALRAEHYRFLFEKEADMADEETIQKVVDLGTRVDVLNDAIVITRDLQRIASLPHPRNWRLHKILRENGYEQDMEYRGDYRGYT